MFNIDQRYIYILLALLVVSGVISTLSAGEGALIGLILTIPAVLVAITFHEFAHALAADKLGDDTPRRQGRLSLNPMAHLDPVGVIMLLFVHIGWGKPVQVNPRNYTRKMSMEKADAIVSLAGPLMNFFLAIVFALIYCSIVKFSNGIVQSSVIYYLVLMIQYGIIINIGLGVFNLIPLPPLDGSKVLMPFLPTRVKYWFQDNEKIFYIIFLVIWVTGIAGNIISPIIDFIGTGILNLCAMIFGI